jgi:hypothetical protein
MQAAIVRLFLCKEVRVHFIGVESSSICPKKSSSSFSACYSSHRYGRCALNRLKTWMPKISDSLKSLASIVFPPGSASSAGRKALFGT